MAVRPKPEQRHTIVDDALARYATGEDLAAIARSYGIHRETLRLWCSQLSPRDWLNAQWWRYYEQGLQAWGSPRPLGMTPRRLAGIDWRLDRVEHKLAKLGPPIAVTVKSEQQE